MATPSITDYLKYANLQMAAEAFLVNTDGTVKDDIPKALKEGNLHASVFTESQANKFAAQWDVVDQRANTETGFSGTLFRNKADPNELVVSFRSTEFIDDAVRDNAATNTLEIKETGWAWGQIADMEKWYAGITVDGVPLKDKNFAVTGYSLGGHLATAFNLLRREDGTQNRITQVVTFNGAGVGKVNEGTLTSDLSYFNLLRANPNQLEIALDITTPSLLTLYRQVHDGLKDGSWNVGQAIIAVNNLTISASAGPAAIIRLNLEKAPIIKALIDINDMQTETERLRGLRPGGTGGDASTPLDPVPDAKVLAEDFDYRLAVGLAAKRTEAASVLFGGGSRAYLGKQYLQPALKNQFDVVGDTRPSAVSNSHWHYGTDVRVFIEDQPLNRGTVVLSALGSELDYGSIKLLVDSFTQNDFGDTHSLVLLVDSLNVQNVFKQLAPDATDKDLNDILREASYLRASSTFGT